MVTVPELKIYRNRDGRWGWACRICPHLDRFGNRIDGRPRQGGFARQSDALLAFERHCRLPHHQVRVREERDLRDYVDRVLTIVGIGGDRGA